MAKYDSKAGVLVIGTSEFRGLYSGHGEGINNPALSHVTDVGPIPIGTYAIGTFFDDPEKGPCVAHLTPQEGTDTFGRSGFMIHGDNKQLNHSASHGCIIAPRNVREALKASGETSLEVA